MTSLSPALLREIAEAHPDGQYGLARWLAARRGSADPNSTRRSLQRYERGERPIPDWMRDELQAAIDARIAELRALRRKLRS